LPPELVAIETGRLATPRGGNGEFERFCRDI
jgi:hypothetical protein